MNTKEQREWLEQNPAFSEVGPLGAVSFHQWCDEGWLSPDGKYLVDDGRTLFADNYPSWFRRTDAVRVGRKVAMA